mgnify:CR=1 FL=1
MVLEFPVLAEYALLEWNGHLIFATHGHLYNTQNPPPLQPGDILLHGHTHIPADEPWGRDNRYWNPAPSPCPKPAVPTLYGAGRGPAPLESTGIGGPPPCFFPEKFLFPSSWPSWPWLPWVSGPFLPWRRRPVPPMPKGRAHPQKPRRSWAAPTQSLPGHRRPQRRGQHGSDAGGGRRHGDHPAGNRRQPL